MINLGIGAGFALGSIISVGVVPGAVLAIIAVYMLATWEDE